MAGLFYQAQFCAECGNALDARRSLWPRYFCADCAARLERHRYVKPLGALLLGAVVALFTFASRQTATQINPSAAISSASVSALDATARQKLALDAPEPAVRVLCGARTRKGTPCRHRVLPGQRCAQHRGQPSMLKQDVPAALLDAPKPVN